MRACGSSASASADGGTTWQPAWQLAGFYAPPRPAPEVEGEALLGAIVPMGRFSGWAVVAGYFAILLLLFGVFVDALVVGMAFTGDAAARKVSLIVGACSLLFGVAPVAGMAALGHRAIRRDPALNGMGRVGFAYVVAALVAAPLPVGIVTALVSRR